MLHTAQLRLPRLIMASLVLSAAGLPVGAATNSSTDGDSPVLDEVVVTAQKRVERLSDVPMSITAASGAQLRDQGIRSTDQLERLVPGFTYQMSSYGTPIYSIRGVGFYDTSAGVSPAVSVYLDQTPLPYSSMARGVLLDIERVEILKGPQGTLFGENSTGGAINYIAAKPTSKAEAGLDVDYGRFNEAHAQAFLSGPLSDTLRGRVVARYEHRDAWQSGFAPNDSKFNQSSDESLGRRGFFNGRAMLDWTPSSRLSVELSLSGWRDTSETQAAQFVRFAPVAPRNPFNAGVYNAFVNSPPPLVPLPHDDTIAGWTAGPNYGRNDYFHQESLRGDLELTDQIKLTSITAYSDYHEKALTDVDGVAYFDQTNNRLVDINSISQELRIANDVSRLKWMVGGNYERDRSDEVQSNGLGSSNNGVGPFRYNLVRQTDLQHVRTWAGFASLDYALTDQFGLEASGRYTTQDRSFAGCLADPGTDGGLATAFHNAFGTPTTPGHCVTMDSPATRNLLPIATGQLDQSNVSWRGGVNWKPASDALLYGNVTKGYKAGSYPVLPGVFASQFEPVTQESVLAYELGAKSSFASNRVQLSGATFYYDYTNKQILGTQVIPPFGNLPKLVNIPKSRVVGGELEATLRPNSNLRFSGGVTYVDSRVLRDPSNPIDPFGAPVSYVGESFPNTPRWQFVGDAEERFDIGRDRVAVFGVGTTTRTASQAAFGNSPEFIIHGYTLLDLRAGLEAADGRWRLQLWGHNVTNRYYVNNVARLIDAVTQTTGLPATYGLSVSVRY
jgi:iron complex outermembrane receptor protein